MFGQNCVQVRSKQQKTLLTNEPVLIAPDFTKQFIMTVDASDQGIGAVLMQEDSNGIQHPICYFSKKLNKHQKVYSTIAKEGLALISGLQHLEVYLSTSTTPVIIYTDHNPLVFINKMKNNNRRLMRWSLSLQDYNLDIRHMCGKANVMADTLSRMFND